MPSLDQFFKLQEHGSNVRTEVVAGVTTFLTMAYIIFVNPAILGDAGVPKDAVFVATCLAAALGTIIMGLYANYPIGMAPGMGLNAYFAYAVVLGMGVPWQSALGAVFISGCLFIIVSLFKVRELIVNGIPHSLRVAITVGLGLFLALIAMKSAGLVVANPDTLVRVGDMHNPHTIMAIFGFLLIVTLDRLKVPGALLIGIVAVTVLSFFFGGNTFHGFMSLPPSISPTLFHFDLSGALSLGLFNVVLVFFLVELFDQEDTSTTFRMPVDSAPGISSLNRVGLIEGGAEKMPWKVFPATKNDRTVTAMMPIRIAPFTRSLSSVTIRKKPTTARIGSGLCRSPAFTRVGSLPTTMPELLSAMSARNRPMPTVIAVRSERGMPATIMLRRPSTVTRMNRQPEMNTAPSAAGQAMPMPSTTANAK
jgi:hypothetical protein